MVSASRVTLALLERANALAAERGASFHVVFHMPEQNGLWIELAEGLQALQIPHSEFHVNRFVPRIEQAGDRGPTTLDVTRAARS